MKVHTGLSDRPHQSIKNTALFGVLIVVSIACITLPAYAVGPYFENESPPRGQTQGPNATWPRPDASLWSPRGPLFVPRDFMKKDALALKNSTEPDKHPATAAVGSGGGSSRTGPPPAMDVINPPADKRIALADGRRMP
jgi:hypothetical protein